MPSGSNPIPPHVLNRRRRNANNDTTVDTNDVADTRIDIDIDPNHQAELFETEQHEIGCMPTYRRHIKEIIAWWKTAYPEIYDAIVFELEDSDKNDPTRHYHSATHDIRYDLLNAEWVKLFISVEKKWKNKEKKIQYGFDHPRRYHDAILKCASLSRYDLSATYKSKMKKYIENLKKEKTTAKTNCQIDEKEADPIGISLLETLCEWCVKAGTKSGIFVWAFMITQWNVMGRTVNVDPLGFHNIKKGEHDSIIIEYDSNKCDKTGVKTTPKNCYSNPTTRPYMSLFLALLGCYLCIFQNKFRRDSDKLFIAEGKDGSASNSYAKALKKIIANVRDSLTKVREYCRDGHFHPHGIRKGAGSHVTTGTMDPPPIPSVLMRGEWSSLGKVLEVYWKYSMIGDTYLGRCLAGFNPDEPGFGLLPPHFSEGMENEYIEEGMMLCFGGIIERFGGQGIEGPLLLFLASIVYHAESFLLPEIANNSSHPFQSIPLLSKPGLLAELKKLVTLEPAGDVQQATGVPRASKMMDELSEVYKALQGYVAEVRELKRTLPEMVKNAIEEKATESGHVTSSYVMEKVTEAIGNATDCFEEKILTAAVANATSHLSTPSNNTNKVEESSPASEPSPPRASGSAMILYSTYKYHDPKATARTKHQTEWDVPLDFDLPSSDLHTAWRAWLLGYPLNKSKKSNGDAYLAPVKPLYLLRQEHNGRLPKVFKKKYDNAWRPILELMHAEVAANIATTPENKVNAAFINATYDLALKNVCTKYPDIASKLSGNIAVSSCSKIIRESNKKRKATQIST